MEKLYSGVRPRDRKVAHWVKAFAAKPEYLRTLMVEGEYQL